MVVFIVSKIQFLSLFNLLNLPHNLILFGNTYFKSLVSLTLMSSCVLKWQACKRLGIPKTLTTFLSLLFSIIILQLRDKTIQNSRMWAHRRQYKNVCSFIIQILLLYLFTNFKVLIFQYYWINFAYLLWQ